MRISAELRSDDFSAVQLSACIYETSKKFMTKSVCSTWQTFNEQENLKNRLGTIAHTAR